MSTQQLHMRFDYVKATISLEYDRAQELAKEWYDTFDPARGANDAPRSANVGSVRRNQDGTYLYVFEAWGEASQNIYLLGPAQWAQHLDRLDVRGPVTITREGIDRLYQHVSDHKAGRKNVSLFSSRTRSKRKGRDTGGYGIAIGSHKSNLRTTFYVRGTEPGAYEFQCMQDALTTIINGNLSMLRPPASWDRDRFWTGVMLSIYAKGWNDFSSDTGLSEDELTKLLSDGPPSDDEVENLVANIDAMIDKLPQDAKLAVFEAMQLRLF